MIFLAGHGYRTPDDTGDEPDRWDETFVCADGALRDDWFRDGLWPRARAGARFVVVVAACHSDTAVLGRPPLGATAADPDRARDRDFHRLVLAACRDEEKTRELVGNDEKGGIVTKAMLEAGASLRHCQPVPESERQSSESPGCQAYHPFSVGLSPLLVEIPGR